MASGPEPSNFHLISLGCVKNTVDSEKVIAELVSRGHRFVADPAAADWILINTCGFINDAREESVRVIVEALRRKNDRPSLRVGAFGCMVRRCEREIREALPELDVLFTFLEPDSLAREFPVVTNVTRSSRGQAGCGGGGRRLLPAHLGTLKIAEGCDNRCAYCTIPSIRGPLVSRPLVEVVEEARDLVAGGARELILVAQDTTRYGEDLTGHCQLPGLVTALGQLPSVHWIRLQYLHPVRLSPELEAAIFDQPKVVPYFDVPFQHVSDRILALMGRGVVAADLRRLVRRLRRRPGAVIRTTFIVGFPGEYEQDFEELLDFIERVPIDRVGAFTWSNEAGTPAARITPKVPRAVRQERLDRLMTLQQLLAGERQQRLVGRTVEVMVDSVAESGMIGRTAGDAPDVDNVVRLGYDGRVSPGTVVMARIETADPYGASGTVRRIVVP